MNVLCVADPGPAIGIYPELKEKINGAVTRLSHQLEIIELERDAVLPCRGCFYCFTKHPGVCVNRDIVPELKQKAGHCGMLIILTPVLFGCFSSVIKNTIDRGLLGEVGLQKEYPIQFIIGYGTDSNDEEQSTFIDITRLHMGQMDIVHPEFKSIKIESFVVKQKADLGIICRRIEENLS